MARVRKTVSITLVAALAALLAGSAVAPAGAEESGWSYELADELMSPFCPGRALSECPSPQAEDLRQWILAQESAGQSREAVEAELFRVWGDQLRQTPRAEGVGLVAYVIPVAAFALGGALVLWFLRRQRAIGPSEVLSPPPLAPVDPELEAQVEEELREA